VWNAKKLLKKAIPTKQIVETAKAVITKESIYNTSKAILNSDIKMKPTEAAGTVVTASFLLSKFLKYIKK